MFVILNDIKILCLIIFCDRLVLNGKGMEPVLRFVCMVKDVVGHIT